MGKTVCGIRVSVSIKLCYICTITDSYLLRHWYLGCRAILLSLLVLAQEGQSVKYSLNILLTCTLYFYSVPAV